MMPHVARLPLWFQDLQRLWQLHKTTCRAPQMNQC